MWAWPKFRARLRRALFFSFLGPGIIAGPAPPLTTKTFFENRHKFLSEGLTFFPAMGSTRLQRNRHTQTNCYNSPPTLGLINTQIKIGMWAVNWSGTQSRGVFRGGARGA